MSKDTFYFSHDYNARSDDKIRALIRKHGMLGYGIYWSIVEDLYNNTNVLRLDYEGIAYELRTNNEIVFSVINDFDLFVFEGEYFGSLSVQNRLEKRKNKSDKARESVLKRWKNKESDTNVIRDGYERNTIKERKGKENKVKDRIVNESKVKDIKLNNLDNAETSSAVIEENILIEDEVLETETISFEDPKKETKEKKGSAEKKESPFMKQCKQIFLDYYENNGQKYIWKPMDDKALGGVISQLKKSLTNDKNEQPSADRVVDLLKALLTKLPDWYKINANSVSVINSKYNDIINQIKNERTKKQSIGDAVADIMSKYHRKQG